MKRFTTTVVISALLALSAVSFAQGGGRGGGRMGGMMMQGGGPANLINREDVQADLKVTAEQKSKLTALQDKQRQEMQAAFEEMRNGGSFDQDAMREMMTKRAKQSEKDVNAILTTDQAKRLKEIWVQISGNSVITNEDMQKELGMTDEQKKKVKDLQAKQQEATTALMEKMRNGEIDREEIQGIFKKNTETFNKEVGKILTDAQNAKLKEMGGKPFKAAEKTGGGN